MMTAKSNSMKPCIVSTRESEFIGSLFINSLDYLALANDIVGGSLVGPLKQSKVRYIDTEANFIIFPREKVREVKLLGGA